MWNMQLFVKWQMTDRPYISNFPTITMLRTVIGSIKTLKHPNIDVLKYLVDGSDKMVKHEDLPMLVNNFLTEPDFEPQYRGNYCR